MLELPSITEDHKVVNQLDEVTKDSEEKATLIFDKLETVLNHSQNIVNIASQMDELVKKSKIKNKEPYQKLIDELSHTANNSMDDVMEMMDIMQYQDIHRQKIERVINIMRALSNYMNSLFSSDIKDEERVSSAEYIIGDNKDDVLSDDEIEAMLKEYAK